MFGFEVPHQKSEAKQAWNEAKLKMWAKWCEENLFGCEWWMWCKIKWLFFLWSASGVFFGCEAKITKVEVKRKKGIFRMFRIKVQQQKIWSEKSAKLKLKWNEKFDANLAKKLVSFFAWAIVKEAEQIPFASFRFKANNFFCKTGSLLSWVLALMKKVSEVDENSLCRLLIYVH